MKKVVWALLVACLPCVAFGQQAQEELYRVIDETVQPDLQGEALPDLEDFSESLFRYLTKPLDLNRATAEDFRLLPFLTEYEIAAILDHRTRYGSFSAVEELQAVKYLPLSQARRLRHYVIATNPQTILDWLPDLLQAKNHSITLRTIVRPGQEQDPRYPGSPVRWYGRYRLARPGAYSLGIIAEKDPGEAGYDWNPDRGRYGPDYLSAHLMVENTAGFKRIIVGDYAMAAGQGLVFAQGFTLGLNAQTVTSLKKRAQGPRPWSSALEGRQLRGICAVKSLGQWEATAFASRKKLDASAVEQADSLTDDTPFPAFRTIRASGLHRTQTELAGQGILTENLLGGQVRHLSKNKLNAVGFTAMAAEYSQVINPKPTAYNAGAFRGDALWAGSFHYSQTLQNLSFFGETALSAGRAWAHYHGVMAALSRKVDIGLSYRDYSRAFAAPYAAGFGHSSLTANEQGLYLGLQVRPFYQLTINTSVDLYRQPWLAYRNSRPATASTGMARITWQPNRQNTFYLQAQRQEYERDLPIEQAGRFRAPQPITLHQWMASAELTPARRWLLRTRVQGSRRTGAGLNRAQGSAILQDITYQGRYIRVSARISAFSVDDADTRLYALERNVLGAYSFTQLNGKGTRYYLVVSAKPTPQLDLWVRVARTQYANPIQSVDLSARTSSITEISLQARIWLSAQKINLF